MKKVLLVIFVLGAMLLSACGGDSATAEAVETLEPVPADYAGKTNPLGPEAAAAGAELFKTNCSSCHGAEGYGDGPAGAALQPHPKNLAAFQAVASDDYLFWRISTGRPGTAMIGWNGVLSEEQIWQLITYLHTLK